MYDEVTKRDFSAADLAQLTGIEIFPCAKCGKLPTPIFKIRSDWMCGAKYGQAFAMCRCGGVKTEEERFDPNMSPFARRNEDLNKFVAHLLSVIACQWNKKQMPPEVMRRRACLLIL